MYFKGILLCGSETWTYTEEEERKVRRVEMKFLRGIMGKSRNDSVRNTYVWGELEMGEI
jgi:hypothetical protein